MMMQHRLISFLLAAVLFSTGLPFTVSAETSTTNVKQQIDQINRSVEQKKKESQALKAQTDRFRSLIQDKKAESAILEDEIGLLDTNIARMQLDIDIAKQSIQSLELQTQVIATEIKSHEEKIASDKKLIGSLSRKLQRAKFRKSPLEALLTGANLSAFFDAWQGVASLQNEVTSVTRSIKMAKQELDVNLKDLESRQESISEEKRNLDTAKQNLEDAKGLKQVLLLETKSSEIEYRYALAELEKEQSDADSEIRYMEKVLREKMDLAERLGRGATVLSWPVDPSRGITALFHDKEYPFRNVFEHPAIDLRAYQGTRVRAAAAGIIARAKDNGYGYNYIMIIHSNSISTVYGHISKIMVDEDQYVERGEVIGLSGGAPGTLGAGRLTTGPHLHFEVRKSGIPDDPLKYLPAR